MKSDAVRRSAEERWALIVERVRARGFVRNSELAAELGVSTVTIRHDIAGLQERGLLRRTYGGAARMPWIADTAHADRQVLNREHKERIGLAAAGLIRPGDAILIDAGSTTVEIAKKLPEGRDVTIVTTALNVALEAGARRGVQVILCGGALNPRTLAVFGPQVEQSLAEVHACRLFLGTYAVDLRRGLAERNMAGAQTKKALIRAAGEIVLVCDSSKFRSSAPILTAPLSALHRVVTDNGIPAEFRRLFKKLKIPVDIV